MTEQFDPRIDAYIAKAPAYAKPIITHIRVLIHHAVPEITETMKWSHPHFDYKGPAFGMGAFKEHMGLNFWKSGLMDDPKHIFKEGDGNAGSIGKIKSLADLPPDDVLIDYFRRAVALKDQGIKATPRKAPVEKKELVVPTDLIAAFKTHTDAMQHFQQFSPSAKREYIEWLDEAKAATTREKRLATMMEWVTEGKTRNWKYKNC